MPRLVKGAKWIYGWSKVSDKGNIVIPPEALKEYEVVEGEKVTLISGSKTSGGFGVIKHSRFMKSKLAGILDKSQESKLSETGVLLSGNRILYKTVILKGGSLNLPLDILAGYGIQTSNSLLVARGSGLAIGFIVRGPIVEEALAHPELEVFLSTG